MIDNMTIFQISKRKEELKYEDFIKNRITDKRDFGNVKRERLKMIRMAIDALQEEERVLAASQTADDVGNNCFRPDILAKPKQSEKLDRITKERDEAYERITELEASANKDFRDSREYKQMQEHIRNLELSEKLQIQHAENAIRSDEKLMRQIKQIRDDNVELCREHGAEYWEGITQQDRYAHKDIRELEKQIHNLESKRKSWLLTITRLSFPVRILNCQSVDPKAVQGLMKNRKSGFKSAEKTDGRLRRSLLLKAVQLGLFLRFVKGYVLFHSEVSF